MLQQRKFLIAAVSILLLGLLLALGVYYGRGFYTHYKYNQFREESIAHAQVGTIGDTLRFDMSYDQGMANAIGDSFEDDFYGGGSQELTLKDVKVYDPPQYLEQHKAELTEIQRGIISQLTPGNKLVAVDYSVTNIDGKFGNDYLVATTGVVTKTAHTGDYGLANEIVRKISGLQAKVDDHGRTSFPEGATLDFHLLVSYDPNFHTVYRLSDVFNAEVIYFDLLPIIK